MQLEIGYDYVNAKLHGIRSRMFEGDRLMGLLDARDLTELAEAMFPDADASGMSAVEMERRLAHAYFDAMSNVSNHLGDRVRQFFTGFVRKADTENLKVVLRHAGVAGPARGAPLEAVRPLLVATPVSWPLRLDEMLRSQAAAEFIGLVPDEGLRTALNEAVQRHPDMPPAFVLEVGLDTWYYQQLLTGVSCLRRYDRRLAREIVALDVDAALLLWTMRLRDSYGDLASQVTDLIVPLAQNLPDTIVTRLSGTTEPQERLRVIPAPYRRCLEAGVLADLTECEQRLHSLVHREAQRYFRRLTPDVAGVVGFYFLKRSEFINLVRVVQAVRYGLSGDAFQRLALPVESQ